MNLRFSSFSFKVGKKYEMNAFFHLFWHLGQIQKRRMGHNLELSHKNARWMSALHSGQVLPERGIQIFNSQSQKNEMLGLTKENIALDLRKSTIACMPSPTI